MMLRHHAHALLLLLSGCCCSHVAAFSILGYSFGSSDQETWNVCTAELDDPCSCTLDLQEARDQVLDCTHRSIAHLHDGMVIPMRFHVLDFSDNVLGNLTQQTFYSNNSHVAGLLLSANKIRSLGKQVFANLPNLTSLDLSNNLISELHNESLSGLSRLETLNLGYNQLYALPEHLLSGCPALTEVILTYNPLTVLPDTLLRGLPALRHLDLTYLRLTTLHAALFRNISLERLELVHNNLDQVPTKALFTLAPSLKYLDLSGNDFQVLPPYSLYNLPHLTELRLEQLFHLRSIEKFALNELPSLHTLVLRYMPKIKFIDEKAFSSNINGTMVPSPVQDFTLSVSVLQQLPQGLLNWPTLKYLNLHNNRWRCDCEFQWVKGSGIESLVGDEFYCSSPTRVQGAPLSMLKEEDFVCLPTDTFSDSWQWGTLALIFGCGLLASLLTVSVLFYRRNGYLFRPPADYYKLHSQSRESITVVDPAPETS